MQGITEIHENIVSRKFGAIWYVTIQLMLIHTSLPIHKQSDLQQTSYRGLLPECKNVNEKDILYNYL